MADYSWRTHADTLGLPLMHAWIACQKAWPYNDRHRQPTSPGSLDRLCEDPDLADFIAATIDDRARSTA